jgi:hypothetical protein
MSLPGRCFSLRISSTSRTTRVFFQSDLIQRLGQDNMRRLVGKMRVVDLSLRSHPARERRNAFGIGQDGLPVLLVAWIHPAAQKTRFDLRTKIKLIFPRFYSIHFPVGPFGEAVHRYSESRDYFSTRFVVTHVRQRVSDIKSLTP